MDSRDAPEPGGEVAPRYRKADAAGAIDARRTAVVVIDMVNHQVTPGRWFLADTESRGLDTTYFVDRLKTLVLPAHRRLLPAARSAGARVVYLRIGSLAADYADASPATRDLFPLWEAHDASPACAVIDELQPQPSDLDILKTGSGGFTTSSLDVHLRNMGVENVLYTGVATNACVLATAASGFDLGYRGFLVSDATATFTQRMQDITEEIIGFAMTEVVTTDHIIGRLRAGRGTGNSATEPDTGQC
ncbi:isochorismatase family cysteine hydrolase [Nocardia sp. NPDC052254]|uniref:cysteine hydrolase family protein n=1 Tax=Nocardia sp. NPDC052254 TaxID=3155681 RepID=UPI00342C78A2